MSEAPLSMPRTIDYSKSATAPNMKKALIAIERKRVPRRAGARPLIRTAHDSRAEGVGPRGVPNKRRRACRRRRPRGRPERNSRFAVWRRSNQLTLDNASLYRDWRASSTHIALISHRRTAPQGGGIVLGSRYEHACKAWRLFRVQRLLKDIADTNVTVGALLRTAKIIATRRRQSRLVQRAIQRRAQSPWPMAPGDRASARSD